MRPSRLPGSSALVLGLLLAQSSASSLDCKNIEVDKKQFNLSPLKGPHSVVTSIFDDPRFINTTYTIDLCNPLQRPSDVDKSEKCPDGSYVCMIQHTINPSKTGPGSDVITEVVPIAGDLHDAGGQNMDAAWTRLKKSDSKDASRWDGLRLVLNGGLSKHGGESRPQKAIVELQCDEKREGTEGEWESEDKYAKKLTRTDDHKDGGDKDTKPSGGEQQLTHDNSSLLFDGYSASTEDKGTDVLRLIWHTKYACENMADSGPPDQQSNHWGFFTWLIILVFLTTASYIIFGSWLNYNRYGARGWDLLPHGDTLRDIPYLLKDWTRRVLNTIQGSGSRGGYSAV